MIEGPVFHVFMLAFWSFAFGRDRKLPDLGLAFYSAVLLLVVPDWLKGLATLILVISAFAIFYDLVRTVLLIRQERFLRSFNGPFSTHE